MKRKLLIIVVIPFIISSCRIPWDYSFSLSNNSGHDIGWDLGFDYPDVSLPDNDDTVNKSGQWDLFRTHTLFSTTTMHPSEAAIIHDLNPNDTVSVFIFHTDTLMKYPWEDVKKGYKVLVRYDLSWEDINRMKREEPYYSYVIPFPPSPAMEHMHMWPPYEEVIAQYGIKP